jgi:hypothetical protein
MELTYLQFKILITHMNVFINCGRRNFQPDLHATVTMLKSLANCGGYGLGQYGGGWQDGQVAKLQLILLTHQGPTKSIHILDKLK